MLAVNLVPFILMLALLAWAAMTDLRSRRIPNWLSLALILSGPAFGFFRGGMDMLLASGLGLAVGFLLPLLLFILGTLGAGDVKLLAGVCAWLGAELVLWIMLAATLFAGAISLLLAAKHRRLLPVLENTALLAVNLVGVRRFGAPRLADLKDSPPVSHTVPCAVAIFVATVGFLAIVFAKSVIADCWQAGVG